MKKFAGKSLCTLIILAMLMFACMAASADGVNTVTVAETSNGSVSVTLDPGNAEKALITLTPDKGYLAAGVSLTAKDGSSIELTKVKTNLYSCAVPAEESTLNASFRMARVVLNKSELAMASGDTFKVKATLTCTDGELNTRNNMIDNSVVFSSSDPAVASVDPLTGELTAHKMGYARITGQAAAGSGVEGFFYVIVDGDKSPVIGTIQLNAHFEEELFINTFLPGHCFLIFTNTSGRDITIPTSGFYQSEVPTAKFYDAVDTYNGEGYDPLTYFYATNGEYQNDDNLEARDAYNDGFFTRYERGELASYTIRPNDIATFGNTGAASGLTDGNFGEILDRYGKSFELEKIKAELFAGTIDLESYVERVGALINEILYDTTNGFNPFNGTTPEGGGECLNHELYAQLQNRNYIEAAACKTKITEVQFMALVDFVQYDNHFTFLERNCSYVASSGWNLVTAAKPQYHMVPNFGSVSNALAAPMFLRNTILSMGVLLSADSEIEFYDGIDVIKPAKGLGIGCEHNFVNGKCTECGLADPDYKPDVSFLSVFTRIISSIRNMFAGMFSWLPFC